MLIDEDGQEIQPEGARGDGVGTLDVIKGLAQEESVFSATRGFGATPEEAPAYRGKDMVNWIVENEDFNEEERLFLLRSSSIEDLEKNLGILNVSRRNDEVLANSSGWQLTAAMGGLMIADPFNFVPAAAAYKFTKLAKAAKNLSHAQKIGGTGVAIGVAEEAIIQANDPDRGLGESLVTIGAVATIGTGVGKLMDAKLARNELLLKKIRASVIDDAGEGVPRRSGFEYAPDKQGLLTKFGELTSPLVRLLSSPSSRISKFAAELLDTPFFTKANREGLATQSLEGDVKATWREYSRYIRVLEDSWLKHMTGKGGGTLRRIFTDARERAFGDHTRMSFREFDEAVTMYRAGAISIVPDEVKIAAQALDEFYEGWGKRAAKFFEGEGVSGGKYLNRRYNFARIAEAPEAFLQFLLSQYRKNVPDYDPTDLEKITNIFQNTIKKMIRNPSERIVLEEIFDETIRGGLKTRYFDFIDEADLYKTDWVFKSSKDATSGYTKSVATDVVFGEKFGTLSIKDIMKRLKQDTLEEFDNLSAEEMALLQEELDLTEAMLNRVRGTYMSPNGPLPGSTQARVIDGAMKFNNITLGGGFLLTSFVDVGRPVMHLGLEKAYGSLFRGLILRQKDVMHQLGKASEELKAWGVANELHYSQRLQSMVDQLPSSNAISQAERMLGKLNDNFFIANGLTLWNDYMKQVTGVAVVDKIISAAEDFAKGRLSLKDKQILAQMGLDEVDLSQIAKEFADHGTTIKGVRFTDAENWVNQTVADRMFKAVQKEVDTIILTPGVGDTPLLMSNAYVALIAQYKTFAMAAQNRMLIRGMQQPDANMINGLTISVVAGIATTSYQNFIHDREMTPVELVSAGISKSGILSTIGEANSILSSTPLGNLAITGRQEDYAFDTWAFGPTAGKLKDSYKLLTARSKQQAEKSLWNLTPYHNLFYIEALLGFNDSQNDHTREISDYYRKYGISPGDRK